MEHAVHVDRAGARLEPVVADEQDDVVGTSAADERADRVVGLAEDVGHLLADARVLVLHVVRVVGRDVVGQAVLRAVDADPDAGHHVPLGVVHEPLAGGDALARDLERLVQVGVGLVVIRGPAHAVDRPLVPGLLQGVLQVGGLADGAALRQHAAGHQVAGERGRRERERHVQQQLVLLRRGQVIEERARLDRLVGDRVGLVGAGHRLQDVVDAVVHRVHPGEEGRPGRPAVRGNRGAQDVLLPPVDERLQVRQRALLEQGVEDAPVGAVPRDQDDS